MTRNLKSKIKKINLTSTKSNIKKLATSSQGLPVFVCMLSLAILLVLFRMTGIDMDYKMTKLRGDIKTITIQNKELKAQKANLLSVDKLKRIARRFKLSEPKEEQIIVIH